MTVWIEKTLVVGNPFRQYGDRALGKSLVSPTLSESGTDIYKLMRAVRSGDVILHLTDNKAFTGFSFASAEAVTITIDGKPWYQVKLEKFHSLNPILERATFFSSPSGEQLRLFDPRGKRLFYTRNLTLQQGAYLTRCPEELLKILDGAYRSVSSQTLMEQFTARSTTI